MVVIKPFQKSLHFFFQPAGVRGFDMNLFFSLQNVR